MPPPNSKPTAIPRSSLKTPSKLNPRSAPFEPTSQSRPHNSPKAPLQPTNPSALNPQVSSFTPAQTPITEAFENPDTLWGDGTSDTLAESYYMEGNSFDYERLQTPFYNQYEEVAAVREALDVHGSYQDMPKNPYLAVYPNQYDVPEQMPVQAYQPLPGPAYDDNHGEQGPLHPLSLSLYCQHYYPQEHAYAPETGVAVVEEVTDQENENVNPENQLDDAKKLSKKKKNKKNKAKQKAYKKKQGAKAAKEAGELERAKNGGGPSSSSRDVDQQHGSTKETWASKCFG
ncbi:hypothetical protein DM02DRAFT_656323 [Periconia macrospinosa]|uniref:Uncharacterized protein n=1 Tax=Periconia macrospinosa TaxID=97972 RepID=A0A2V1DNP9_9PLEO|nr:hypothetical protein DM02DRAFT_656323 [Periconia macrospinosa]